MFSGINNIRLQYLYKIWEKVLNLSEFPQFDLWLSDEFKKQKKFGKTDRRWYSEHLFAAIRYGYLIAFCFFLQKNKIEKILSSADLYLQIRLFNEEYQKYNILESWKKINIIDFFNFVLSRMHKEYSNTNVLLLKQIDNIITNLSKNDENIITYYLLWYGIPVHYQSFFERRIKENNWDIETSLKFIVLQEERPPLWLRPNNLLQIDNILQMLKEEEFDVSIIDTSIKVIGNKGIYSTKCFKDGLIEIQDLASQLVGKSLDAKPGQVIWDCCAGGGGKTIQIASYLNNKGIIYASDIRDFKLQEVKHRAKRAGFFNIRCLVWDGKNIPIFPKEISNKNGFDKVLVDAPCTATGTWRRNPDAKYKITNNVIQEITNIQFNILQNASVMVNKHGQLIYATCSFLCEENEEIVSKFLMQNNESWYLVKKELFSPPKYNSDTLFVAIFKRK